MCTCSCAADLFGIEAHFNFFLTQPNVFFVSVDSMLKDPEPVAAFLGVNADTFRRIETHARHTAGNSSASDDKLGSTASARYRASDVPLGCAWSRVQCTRQWCKTTH